LVDSFRSVYTLRRTTLTEPTADMDEWQAVLSDKDRIFTNLYGGTIGVSRGARRRGDCDGNRGGLILKGP